MNRLALTSALLLFPSALAAQNITISSYVAADEAVPGGPMLVGATMGREYAHFGTRLGAGVDMRTIRGMPEDPFDEEPSRVLHTDADALLFLANSGGSASVIPYAVAGVGLRVLREYEGTALEPTWNYGGGIRTPVFGWLSLEGEARRREPFHAREDATAAGWELRAGLRVRFGGRSTAGAVSHRPALPAGTMAPTARRRVAERTLDAADDYLGVPYLWGGNTPQSGFDCSGFIRYVFERQGIALPRVSRDQARAGIALPLDLRALEPGDLLSFASDGSYIDHIAIYAGDGRIIHSSQSGEGVRFDDLNSERGRWYREHWVAATRVIY